MFMLSYVTTHVWLLWAEEVAKPWGSDGGGGGGAEASAFAAAAVDAIEEGGAVQKAGGDGGGGGGSHLIQGWARRRGGEDGISRRNYIHHVERGNIHHHGQGEEKYTHENLIGT